MASDWQTLSLAEAGVQLIDCDHRTPPAAESGYPYIAIPQLKDGRIDLSNVRRISAADYADWTRKLKPQSDDVIVVRRCNSGESAVVPAGLECAIGQNLVVLRTDGRRIDRRYLRWIVRGPDWWSEVGNYINVGAVFDSLRCRDIPNFRVLVPSLAQQVQISEFLQALDDRIDLLRQTNTTLEAIAQALFKSWFVDFNPVHAKAEGREPEGMDAATAALFPSEFEESEIGLIPKGWRSVFFGSLLSESIGGDWGSENATTEQSEVMAVVRGTDIPDLRAQSTSRVPLRFTSARKLASRALSSGDLVVEVSGGSKDQPTGRSLYVTNELLSTFECPVVPASFCRKFSPTTKDIGMLLAHHMDYIYAKGKTWEYQTQSTGIANFQTKHFLATERVVLPPMHVLRVFCDIASPIARKVQIRAAQQLGQLRDTLLPRLISGKLRIPEAEALVDEVSA